MVEKITFGIISPYAAQVDLFRKVIYKNRFFEQLLPHKLISIKTIDGFQGQERDVIVISLVRSNERSKIGFLADYRRINVALTRAKKKLFQQRNLQQKMKTMTISRVFDIVWCV